MTITAIIGSILASLIILLLGQLIMTINRLTKKVEVISELLAVSNNNLSNMKENCNAKHLQIDTRLNDHSIRIKDCEIKIAHIK